MSCTATVKWFDAKKGYGFASPEKGGEDIFIHVANIAKDADGKSLFLDDGDTIYCAAHAPQNPCLALRVLTSSRLSSAAQTMRATTRRS